MTLKGEAELREELHRAGIRGRVKRAAIIWTPFAVVLSVLTVYYAFDTAFNDGAQGGTWVLVGVVGVVASLFVFQSQQALRDLKSQPVVVRGEVTRRWARTDSFVLKSHYVRVGRLILRGDAFQLAGIEEGHYVEATYFPYSGTLVWAEKVARPEDDAAEGASEPA